MKKLNLSKKKNIIIIVLTFSIFAYLSRFGLDED